VLLIGGMMLQLLALGDSYTIGESVAEAERWPVQLTALVEKRGRRLGRPRIIAQTGWTTDELAAAIEREKPQGPFDYVSLLIGVNNQYRGRGLDEYRDQFRQLLRHAIAFAGGRSDRVIVLSIPDWGVTPFAEGRDRARIGEEIDQFNRVNREEAVRAGARYVDITPVSRLARTDGTLLAEDGLHPSGAMYHRWAELVEPLIIQ
jgi:lysophospholipase L1-like esterase